MQLYYLKHALQSSSTESSMKLYFFIHDYECLKSALVEVFSMSLYYSLTPILSDQYNADPGELIFTTKNSNKAGINSKTMATNANEISKKRFIF